MNPVVFRYTLLSVFVLFVVFPAGAQHKTKVKKPVKDSVAAVLHDVFTGTIPDGDDSVFTVLQLDHAPGDDFGKFTIDETYTKPGGKKLTFNTPGSWNTLNERVNDEDAVIVEIDGPEKATFFLRIDENMLQKLDPTMQQMESAERYLLKRRINHHSPKTDTLTAREKTMASLCGTFKGKLPCGDCKGLNATLVLRYKAHAKSGDFTLTDKYLGTANGDITNERKGKWSFVKKPAGTVIVIDSEKPGHEAWYLVKKDGVVQVDKNQQRGPGAADLTLKKQ